MRRAAFVPVLIATLASCGYGQTLINGAGATFPYPIYSKWFDVFGKAHTNVQINYQSIGSGGGIRQLKPGTVDFGATDMPMTDEQIEESLRTRCCTFPTVLGAVVPTYNIPGVTAELNFTPEALAGIFLGTITKWNDPAIAKANPGVKLPDERHRRRASLGRKRHHLHLDRLSLEGEPRVEDQSGRGHFGELAGRARRKGQRRRRRTGEADAEFDRLRRADLRRPEQDARTARCSNAARHVREGDAGDASRRRRPARPRACRTIFACRSPTRRARKPTRSPASPGY